MGGLCFPRCKHTLQMNDYFSNPAVAEDEQLPALPDEIVIE